VEISVDDFESSIIALNNQKIRTDKSAY